MLRAIMARGTKEVEPINYYPINEAAARQAKEMNSFYDYKEGSATEEYRGMVNDWKLQSNHNDKSDLKASMLLLFLIALYILADLRRGS